jgi:exonuclease SbcC
MIKSLQIQNFQSHKDTTLDFHAGVNVLTGQSDCGKSAILRALNWLINNRPSGDSFRSDWGGDTVVVIEADDWIITRGKTNKDNTYTTSKGASSGVLTYKAMGQGVPEEVISALNMPPLNIQYQMDAPFLLSLSEGQVAQYLNEIAKLDVIDKATTNINNKIKRLNANIETTKANLEDTQAKLKDIAYIEEMEKKVKQLETASGSVAKVRTDEQELNNIVNEIRTIKEKVDGMIDTGTAQHLIKSYIKLDDTAEAAWQQADKIQKTLDSIEDNTLKIKQYEVYGRASRLLDRLSKLDSEYLAVGLDVDAIEIALDQVDIADKKLKAVEVGLKNLNEWWKKNAPDVCPLCTGKGKLK